ncbi:hypothetical protein C0J52_07956 [Blattella germanica]|nr:hypothetical protein C0J52_07956 [Blattella germanica]
MLWGSCASAKDVFLLHKKKKLYAFSSVVILRSTVGRCFRSFAFLQLHHFTFLLISYICSRIMMSETCFLDYTPMTRETTGT